MPTTPKKTPKAEVGDTPTHDRMSSFHPFTSTAEEYDPAFVIAANEMAGKYLGPVSTTEFLSYYLPESKEMSDMPEFHAESFKSVKVTAQRLEPDMYNPIDLRSPTLLPRNCTPKHVSS